MKEKIAVKMDEGEIIVEIDERERGDKKLTVKMDEWEMKEKIIVKVTRDN